MTSNDIITSAGVTTSAVLSLATIQQVLSIVALVISIITVLVNVLWKLIVKYKEYKGNDGSIDHNEAKDLVDDLIDGLDEAKDLVDEYQGKEEEK